MLFQVRASRYVTFAAWLLCLATGFPALAESYTFHHEHILGTSLELRIDADTETAALQAEAAALAEIERLARIFSSYDDTSEFSRWQTGVGTPATVSSELFDVLAASERWQKLSQGAFNPAAEVLSALWRNGARLQRLPEEKAIAATVQRIQGPHWSLDRSTREATRLTDVALTLNAIAKGAVVEAACQTASQVPGVRGMLVSIGGDLRVRGHTVHQIGIADPARDAVNAEPLTTVFLHDRALATSGGYRRGFNINGAWYSHIFDPRTGYPARNAASATVVAENTTDADALATICCVLTIEESLALVASFPGVECLLIAENGRRHTSARWRDLEQPQLFRLAAATRKTGFSDATGETEATLADPEKREPRKPESAPANAESDSSPEKAAATELLELTVQFELAKADGSRYRRPYVAIWLEDEDEHPVRTAVLWLQTRQPGPRWHRDLLRWYRSNGSRKLPDGKELIGTVSGATRGPGEYKALFDGKDESGKPLKPGNYTLFIEAAREHGTYQLIRHPLKLGSDPIEETKLKGNVEIKSASLEYRARKPDTPDKSAGQ